MTKKTTLLFLITNLSIFIPTPAYVGYGLVLILGTLIIFSACILFSSYIHTIESKYRFSLLLLMAGLVTLLYHQGITLFSPIIGLTLGYILYLIPLSILAFDALLTNETESVAQKRSESFKILFLFAAIALFFFFLREFLAFGTISYPTRTGIAIIQLPIFVFEGYAFFWSTIPGAIVVLALFMVIFPFVFLSKGKEETK